MSLWNTVKTNNIYRPEKHSRLLANMSFFKILFGSVFVLMNNTKFMNKFNCDVFKSKTNIRALDYSNALESIMHYNAL